MTEPADQPLLEEQSAETKKPARKRTTTKARTSATKTTKPKAKKTTKVASKSKAAKEEVESPAEVAPVTPPIPTPPPAAPVAPAIEEWRPSASKAEPAPAVSASPAAATPTPAPAAPAAPASTQPVVRPRPVYIPRHVAKQMEEQARAAGIDPAPIPVAVSQEEAARLDLPRVEAALRAESPRPENPRHERHERG